MTAPTNPVTAPSRSQILAELEAIEDRMYVIRACATARRAAVDSDPELLRLVAREQRLMGLLRLCPAGTDVAPTGEVTAP